MLLFIDTETTPVSDNPPRLISLAAILTTNDGIISQTLNSLVKPSGFRIENSHIHGIAHEHAATFGDPVHEVLSRFLTLCSEATIDPITSRVIGHNVSFDINVLSHEMHSIDPSAVAEFASLRPFCTMLALARIWHTQWPKLGDAYKRLIGQELAHKHTAMSDCLAVMDIFMKGRENGYWR